MKKMKNELKKIFFSQGQMNVFLNQNNFHSTFGTCFEVRDGQMHGGTDSIGQ